MRKSAITAVLAVAVTGLFAASASAQSGLVEIADPGQRTLTGTETLALKDGATGAVLYQVSCDVNAAAEVGSDGGVMIGDWDVSGSGGGGSSSCGANGQSWDDCSDAGIGGNIVPPGTEWSIGDGFSVFAGLCITLPTGYPASSDDAVSLFELNEDATSWTASDVPIGPDYGGGDRFHFSAELQADASLTITGLE